MKDVDLQRRIDSLLKDGWSYGKLAKELGVSKTTIRRWHKGENKPSYPYYEEQLDELLKNVEKKEEPKHQFKVGDRVQFKSWKEMENEFGLCGGIIDCRCSFTDEMKHLCGTYATIVRIFGDGFVELVDFTTQGDTYWAYSTDMLKPFSVDEQIKWHEQKIAELKTQKEKDKWQFTEDEKVILRNLPKEYKWITRDKNGELFVFSPKPKRDSFYGVWCVDSCAQDFYSLRVLKHLFQCIKWSDTEPCEFRKFI